jgi:hypothetical protein
VEFPFTLDVYDFCTEELKANMQPIRQFLRDRDTKRKNENQNNNVPLPPPQQQQQQQIENTVSTATTTTTTLSFDPVKRSETENVTGNFINIFFHIHCLTNGLVW